VLVEKIKQYNEISNFVFSCEHFTMNSSSFSFKTESNVPTKKRKLNRDLSCLQITGQVGSGMEQSSHVRSLRTVVSSVGFKLGSIFKPQRGEVIS
jgi:hypothetical protein